MSMYVDYLMSALKVDRPSGHALIDDALVCRDEMLTVGSHHGDSAYSALAAQVAYDRALINLCRSRGIAVAPTSFKFPSVERNRLEQELANAGIHLADLARRGDRDPK